MNHSPNISLPSLRDLLHAHELFAKKSFGQHFLLDEHLLDEIAQYAGDIDGVQVFEIGPGPGGLTRAMLKRGAHITIIEKDPRFLPLLEPLMQAYPGKLTILQEDALKVNLLEQAPAPRKIIANLPYNVGSLMLINWLQQIAVHGTNAYASLTLMFQKEVAERLIAARDTSEYGRLSILTQWLCDVQWMRDVPAGAFSPPPKVASAVVTLTPLASPRFAANTTSLERVVAAAFNQRRKMLRGSLKALGVDVEHLLDCAEIEGTLRAEVLSVEDFCRLANAYDAMQKNS